MRQIKTHMEQRSFSMDRKSTISTRQNVFSPSKSTISKSTNQVRLFKEKKNNDFMSSSVPIEIYFNPKFRKQYVHKVIDSFFTDSQIQKNQQNPQISQSLISQKKNTLRNRLLGWKKKSKPVSDFQLIDSSKFIRSSPKKSIISQISGQKTLQLVNEDNSLSELQRSRVQNSKSFIDSIPTVSMVRSRIFRPSSQEKKRPKINLFFDSNKSTDFDSYSVFLNQPSLSPKQKMRKQVKVMTYSDKYFQQFNVLQNGILVSKMRRYLGQNNPLLLREQKLNKKGIKTFWKNAMMPNTLEYPSIKSIKDQISQQFKYGGNQMDSYVQIYSKTYYNQLFLNKNEELVDIITSMTKFIIKNKGDILTNGFQIQNLYKIKEKQFLLKDLGSSALVEKIQLRDKNIVYLYPPFFKGQETNGKWLIRPEYLSPEIINSLINNQFQWISLNPNQVMASEVWSLGCMILQMLTLIPLNSDVRCRLKSNPQNLRRGFLSIKFNQRFIDFQTLQRKQKGLESLLRKTLVEQLKNTKIQSKVLVVLQKMLIYDSQKRIKPQQILSDLLN